MMQRSTDDEQLHPVYYFSQKTTEHEKNYISFELEVLAVVKALQKFRVYLLNKPFTIVTDCKAFVQTMEKKDICTRIARWAIMLQDFEYTVIHRSGKRMDHVDALSRYPIATFTIVAQIKQSQDSDIRIAGIKEKVLRKSTNEYCMSNGIVYRQKEGRHLLVIPDKLAESIVRKCHEDNGHFGKEKLQKRIKQEYDIQQLEEKIQSCISNCIVCLVSDRKRGKKEGYLHPIPKEDHPLQTYHIDHLGPMTTTDKLYKYVFAVTDGFCKFCWLYATKSVGVNEVIHKLELQQSVFGNPQRIISDRGSAFTSNEFADFCSHNNIEHIAITTGIPRGNGQIERVNTSIISILTKLCQQTPKNWYKHLNEVQMVLNGTYQRAIGTTPFEVLMGTKMRTKSDARILELLNAENLDTFNQERERLRQEAKQQIAKVQEENRQEHNKKCKPAHLYVLGDLVFIRRTQFGGGLKIKPHFLGPYKVTKIKRNERYEVEKVGDGEGPLCTSTSSDNMKLFSPFETNEIYNGRVWEVFTNTPNYTENKLWIDFRE